LSVRFDVSREFHGSWHFCELALMILFQLWPLVDLDLARSHV